MIKKDEASISWYHYCSQHIQRALFAAEETWTI